MQRFLLVGLVLVSFAPLGCSSHTTEKFYPSESQARKALETALSTWKNGQARPGKLTMEKIGIEVVDANWSSGQKLTAFEIVSEEAGKGPRIFSVKLTMGQAVKTTKYVVVGNDPLWVYGEADYNKLSGS